MSSDEELDQRFGKPNLYEDTFCDMNSKLVRKEFETFHENRNKTSEDNYENARQEFLRLLGQHKMIWYPTNPEVDFGVEVSRIYRHDMHEFLAFMRVYPRGLRSERTVPSNCSMSFHVLIGTVNFVYRRKPKVLHRGNSIVVASKSTYSIRCLNYDQPAYLIFRILKNLPDKRAATKTPQKDSDKERGSAKKTREMPNRRSRAPTPMIIEID